VTSVGFLCNGDGSTATLTSAIEHMLSLAPNKSEPLQFAVGEALCFVFGGTRTTDSLPNSFCDPYSDPPVLHFQARTLLLLAAVCTCVVREEHGSVTKGLAVLIHSRCYVFVRCTGGC
jgi:hypothetical protein